MENQLNIRSDRHSTLLWIPHFRKHPNYGTMRLKVLIDSGYGGYPPFDIYESMLDKVLLKDFTDIEHDRLPLFIGSQFGIYPHINTIPGFFCGEREVAILSKSLLSGHVSGLNIYRISAEANEFKLGSGLVELVEGF